MLTFNMHGLESQSNKNEEPPSPFREILTILVWTLYKYVSKLF